MLKEIYEALLQILEALERIAYALEQANKDGA